jgi:hypothetical protein
VFYPTDLHYPDIKDADFYDKIGCPHLRFKHPTKAEILCMEIQAQQLLQQRGNKKQLFTTNKQWSNTDHLRPDYLDKIVWRVWEVYVDDMGVWQQDPEFCEVENDEVPS